MSATFGLVAACLCAIAGCNRDDSTGKGGPAERAGRELDRALGKAGQAVEKAGRDMQEASKGSEQDAAKNEGK
ncbi:MAG: hypothetical protein ABR570_18005 [Burkholderiales bacterium]